MKYFITVEHTYRICVDLEADTPEEAEDKADEIRARLFDTGEIFTGDVTSDYSLCDETGRTIIDWCR